ncbi:MAG: hypothetical protein A2Z25_24530 [Planctomycetes bacterium RBG_16_55_9]|nr:MAG: hypothetical protein A2Z25_24530 [Planctomycetes bacterium RBG_16_55_9]
MPIRANKGTEQCWYFYPDGAGESVMMRLVKFSDSGTDSYCQYLQNQHANYTYDRGTIYISNSRMFNPDLSVRRLPTDDEALSRFISRVEGRQTDMETVADRRKGLLVISARSSNIGDRVWRIDRHTNVLEEEYFQSDWPQSAKQIDNRDPMHQRGWTYFRVAGHINAEPVSGAGRIPFAYATSRLHAPWLRLKLQDGSEAVDTGTEAYVSDGSGKTVARYEGGSFFAGLGRPWMGLHTADTVRRDAAKQQVWFETKHVPGGGKAEVVLTCDQVKLVYTMDMETDIVEKITFSADNGGEGELLFSYLQDIDNVGSEFVQPGARSSRSPRKNPPGILWLVKLVNGRW